MARSSTRRRTYDADPPTTDDQGPPSPPPTKKSTTSSKKAAEKRSSNASDDDYNDYETPAPKRRKRKSKAVEDDDKPAKPAKAAKAAKGQKGKKKAVTNDDELIEPPKPKKGKKKVAKVEKELDAELEDDAEYVPPDVEEEPADEQRFDEEEEDLASLETKSKSASRRKPKSIKKFDLTAFDGVISISPETPVDFTERTNALCHDELAKRYRSIVRARATAAHASALDDDSMSSAMRLHLRKFESVEQAVDASWTAFKHATTKKRRAVLGGILLGLCDVTHLPAITDQDVRGWATYLDLVTDIPNEDLPVLYSGSATACKESGYAWSRMVQYCKFKMDADGPDNYIAPDNVKSFHLRNALQPGAKMNLRVVSNFDPVTTVLAQVIAAEGFLVDLFQTMDGQLPQWHLRFSEMKASQAAAPAFAKSRGDFVVGAWRGGNHATPLKQGIRSCPVAIRFAKEHNFQCPLCHTQRPEKELWPTMWKFERLDMTVRACNMCYQFFERNPQKTVAEYREYQEATAGLNIWEKRDYLRRGQTPQDKFQTLVNQGGGCAYQCNHPPMDPSTDGPSKELFEVWRSSRLELVEEMAGAMVCDGCMHVEYEQLRHYKNGTNREDQLEILAKIRTDNAHMNQWLAEVGCPPRYLRAPHTKLLKLVDNWRNEGKSQAWADVKANGFCCKLCTLVR